MLALLTGSDAAEPTRAVGAMLISPRSGMVELLVAAALVHMSVSFFWTATLGLVLPRRHIMLWATLAAGAIAVLDLRIIGRLFPEIFDLPFWPQFADHLAWGFTVGVVLDWRLRRRSTRKQAAPHDPPSAIH
jgi:uncharacterized membrane protein YagU involved in acid resistance